MILDDEDVIVFSPRIGGAGGQQVAPEVGVSVFSQALGVGVIVKNERSQHKNKAEALRLLRVLLEPPITIGSDARDALNCYAKHATTAIGATWSERDQLRNREERRSYACAFLAALIRDNPDLLPEYTAAVLADEIKRGVRR